MELVELGHDFVEAMVALGARTEAAALGGLEVAFEDDGRVSERAQVIELAIVGGELDRRLVLLAEKVEAEIPEPLEVRPLRHRHPDEPERALVIHAEDGGGVAGGRHEEKAEHDSEERRKPSEAGGRWMAQGRENRAHGSSSAGERQRGERTNYGMDAGGT